MMLVMILVMMMLLLLLVSFDSHEYTATIDGDQQNRGPGGIEPVLIPFQNTHAKMQRGCSSENIV